LEVGSILVLSAQLIKGAFMAQHETHALDQQVALVTGASSGLGRATAIALPQAGADVAIVARSETDLQQVASEIEALGQRALASGFGK
jgi:NADP-dependent 3-hydroxy acid dehydrogenase YdfG